MLRGHFLMQVTACVGDTVTFDFLGEHNIWSLDNRASLPHRSISCRPVAVQRRL